MTTPLGIGSTFLGSVTARGLQLLVECHHLRVHGSTPTTSWAKTSDTNSAGPIAARPLMWG